MFAVRLFERRTGEEGGEDDEPVSTVAKGKGKVKARGGGGAGEVIRIERSSGGEGTVLVK